jgi:hypothetical protein
MAAGWMRGGRADELNLSNFMQNSGFLVFMFGPLCRVALGNYFETL